MTTTNRERIVMTLPLDPQLARLSRRVTYHFLRENGVHDLAARREALTVERGCQAMLRRAPRGSRADGRALVLVLTSGQRGLEVIGRQRPGGTARRLASLRRAGSP